MNPPINTVETKRKHVGLSPSNPPPGGKGPNRDRYPIPNSALPPAPSKLFQIAMFGILVAVSMTFFVLCSAYVFLVAQPHVWRPISLPALVWVSTALILASSYLLNRARHAVDGGRVLSGRNWVSAAVLLGVGFLASQVGAWYQLSRTGLFEAGNQQRSFFLILSVTHGAHVLAGLAGLIYLAVRTVRNRPAGKLPLPSAIKTIGLFWHFMAGIWLFILTLLLVWK